jgi:hypothetical protein
MISLLRQDPLQIRNNTGKATFVMKGNKQESLTASA